MQDIHHITQYSSSATTKFSNGFAFHILSLMRGLRVVVFGGIVRDIIKNRQFPKSPSDIDIMVDDESHAKQVMKAVNLGEGVRVTMYDRIPETYTTSGIMGIVFKVTHLDKKHNLQTILVDCVWKKYPLIWAHDVDINAMQLPIEGLFTCLHNSDYINYVLGLIIFVGDESGYPAYSNVLREFLPNDLANLSMSYASPNLFRAFENIRSDQCNLIIKPHHFFEDKKDVHRIVECLKEDILDKDSQIISTTVGGTTGVFYRRYLSKMLWRIFKMQSKGFTIYGVGALPLNCTDHRGGWIMHATYCPKSHCISITGDSSWEEDYMITNRSTSDSSWVLNISQLQ
jgi:hypothetical protein